MSVLLPRPHPLFDFRSETLSFRHTEQDYTDDLQTLSDGDIYREGAIVRKDIYRKRVEGTVSFTSCLVINDTPMFKNDSENDSYIKFYRELLENDLLFNLSTRW